jgi:hypothetical protein
LSQTSKSKKCTKCNLEFSSKYKFCTECGQALKKINNCPSCSSRLNKSSKFCSNCGESINPSRNGAEAKPVYVPYSASKDEFNEEETSEEGSDKAKESVYLTIGYALSGLVFLIIVILIFTSLSSGSSGAVYNEDPLSFLNNSYYDPNTGIVWLPSP